MIVIKSTITRVFEHKLSKHVSGHGPDAVFQTDSAGWYIQIGGKVTIHVGSTPPNFTVGQPVEIKIG